MKETEFVYKRTFACGETEAIVCGVHNLIYATIRYKGKDYEKLIKVNQPKTKNADEVLETEMEKVVNKIKSWIGWLLDGRYLYSHGFATNLFVENKTLARFFDDVAEGYIEYNGQKPYRA